MIAAGRIIQMEDAAGFPVAVKRWDKKDAEKAEWEEKMLKLMEGKGVPEFIRSFADAEYVYVVTEWISGVTLDTFVEESGGFLRSKQALEIGDRLLEILKKLHNHSQGTFVYTDLKPSNILVKEGNVYLVDYESVCAAGSGVKDYDRKTVVMGTRPFTAPEIFTGHIQPEADYYSLGALMFYMLTGQLWCGDAELLNDKSIGNGVLELLNPDPSKRKRGLNIFPSENFRNVIKQKPMMVAEPHFEINRSKVVFVNDNPRFAVEMAYEAATHMNLKVGIFSVLEADNPTLVERLELKVKEWPVCALNSAEEEQEFLETSETEQWLDRGYLIKGAGCKGMFVSLIQPRETLRHTEMKHWGVFCEWARRNFDMTILVGRAGRDYIAYFADRIIMAIHPDLWEIHSAEGDASDLADCIYYNSVRYVAWEYKEGVSLTPERFADKVGQDRYIGEIYYDSNRLITENRKQLPYCFSMPDVVKQQYERIIRKIFY